MYKTFAYTCLLALSLSSAQAAGLYWDEEGKLVMPDDRLLYQALKMDNEGYKGDAMRKLKESAEFGNNRAKFFVGLLYLQQDNYVDAYAWLKLAGDGTLHNDQLTPKVEQTLKDRNQLSEANDKLDELKQTYNGHASLMRRMKWKKSIQFTGSRIQGYIPPGFRTSGPNGGVVTGFDLNKLMDHYVFEYEDTEGLVKLQDIEVVEESSESDQ